MFGEARDVLGRQGGGQLQKLVGEEQGGHCGVQPARKRPGGLAQEANGPTSPDHKQVLGKGCPKPFQSCESSP